jgi:hypothetical protein
VAVVVVVVAVVFVVVLKESYALTCEFFYCSSLLTFSEIQFFESGN